MVIESTSSINGKVDVSVASEETYEPTETTKTELAQENVTPEESEMADHSDEPHIGSTYDKARENNEAHKKRLEEAVGAKNVTDSSSDHPETLSATETLSAMLTEYGGYADLNKI